MIIVVRAMHLSIVAEAGAAAEIQSSPVAVHTGLSPALRLKPKMLLVHVASISTVGLVLHCLGGERRGDDVGNNICKACGHW